MVDRRTAGGAGDSTTPERDDPRGEDLARDDLADPGAYEVSADETEAEELSAPASEGVEGESEIDDPDQLTEAEFEAREASSTEPESLAERVKQARPARKQVDVPKKDVATPRRRARAKAVEQRTTPAQFVNQSVDELKKVVWPTGQQVRQYFLVVLVFVLFIMAYVVALDTGFGALLLKIFG